MYELIRGHGRTDIYLFYATITGDFTRVVGYWILEEEWAKAIEVISRQVGIRTPYLPGFSDGLPCRPIWKCTIDMHLS